jgi:hypothetical protein
VAASCAVQLVPASSSSAASSSMPAGKACKQLAENYEPLKTFVERETNHTCVSQCGVAACWCIRSILVVTSRDFT